MSKIVFFGNEQLAQGLENPITPVLSGLLSSGHEISALVLPRRPKIVSRKSQELKIVEVATTNKINTLYADEIDLEKELRNISADIGVLVSYGRIISQKIIDIFPRGIVNIHPSKLPKYRGPTPIESAILNGDKSAGVSLMSLTNEMDAGPIYKQKSIPLDDHEDKNTLYEKLSTLGSEMLVSVLPEIISDDLKPHKQPHVDRDVSYTQKLIKTDGNLNPSIMAATECDRKIRAFLGFPKTRIKFCGDNIIITKAKDLGNFDGNDWPDIIKCANDTALQVVEVVSPKSGKNMKVSDYLNGIKQ